MEGDWFHRLPSGFREGGADRIHLLLLICCQWFITLFSFSKSTWAWDHCGSTSRRRSQESLLVVYQVQMGERISMVCMICWECICLLSYWHNTYVKKYVYSNPVHKQRVITIKLYYMCHFVRHMWDTVLHSVYSTTLQWEIYLVTPTIICCYKLFWRLSLNMQNIVKAHRLHHFSTSNDLLYWNNTLKKMQ